MTGTDFGHPGKAVAEEVDAAVKREMRSAYLQQIANKPYPVPAIEVFEPSKSDREEGEDPEPTVEFKQDFGLERIGLALIHDKYEVKFSHLKPIRIEYLWKRKGGFSKGRVKLGAVMAAPPVLSGLIETPPDYLIWLAADHARFRWTGRMVEAVLFHELSHLTVDYDTGRVVITGHDFEGFHDELVEYPDVSPVQLEAIGRWKQLSLWGGGANGR